MKREDLEDFVIFHDPQLRKELEEALEDAAAGRLVSWEELVAKAKADE